jgi:predicted RNA-binding protein with EMAP domain
MASKTKKLRLINPVEALRALHDNYFGSDKEDVIAEGSVAERVHKSKKVVTDPDFQGKMSMVELLLSLEHVSYDLKYTVLFQETLFNVNKMLWKCLSSVKQMFIVQSRTLTKQFNYISKTEFFLNKI